MDLDGGVFWDAVESVSECWGDGVWGGAGAVIVSYGKARPDMEENKASTMTESVQKMFFDGRLLTNTFIVMTPTKISIATSGSKKFNFINGILDSKPNDAPMEVEVMEISKGDESPALEKLIDIVKEAVEKSDLKKMLTLDQDLIGDLAAEWKTKLDATGIESEDAWHGLQVAIAHAKSPERLEKAKKSAAISIRAMKKVFFKTMVKTFENDDETSNKQVAKRVADHLKDPIKMMKIKDSDYKNGEAFLPFYPTVQSGGSYDVSKLSADSPDTPFSSDVLICQLGIGFEDFVSVIGRTHLFNASKSQEKAYNTMYKAHELLVKSLKPGVKLGEVYDTVRSFIETDSPDLLNHFPSELGHGVGYALEYPSLCIKSGSEQIVRSGMAFVISTCLKDLLLKDEEKNAKVLGGRGIYSLVITDTIVVGAGEDNVSGLNLTAKYGCAYDDIHYKTDDSEDEDEDDGDNDDADMEDENDVGAAERVTRSQTKTPEQLAAEKEAMMLEGRIEKQQSDLMAKKARKALRKLGQQVDDDDDDDENEKDDNDDSKELVNVYPEGSRKFPKELIRNQIYCDKKNEAVFVPIGGCHVPFHISTIKKVNRIDEDKSTLLRFQFFFPTSGASFARDVPNSMRNTMTKFPHLNYIKELTFRSRSSRNLTHQFRLIKEMQKRVRTRLRMKEQEADLVEQKDLEMLKDRRPPQLEDISMRPPIRKGKCIGRLQAHKNGFRFRTSKNETFDLIYANIKHFFFQECKNELTVLVHFRLKQPVLIGRTKTYDVQFYTEVFEASAASDGRRRNMLDPDEEEEERRELIFKKKLNSMFRKFCQDVVGLCSDNQEQLGTDNDYDKPYRKLAFQGVPYKEMVTLIPTVHCLVNLTETPFFCVTLDEIEHIHFERVGISSNFDMVIILKSNMQPDGGIPHRITSIPRDSLQMIRQWLHDKGDVTFTAGNTSLNWKLVMDGVHQELEEGVFWKSEDSEGEKAVGWNFLKIDDDDEEEEEDVAGSEESAFDGSDAASSEEEDDWAAEVDSSSSEDSGSDDEEDDGEDWDELDRRAKEADKKRERKEHQSDDDEPVKKRKK